MSAEENHKEFLLAALRAAIAASQNVGRGLRHDRCGAQGRADRRRYRGGVDQGFWSVVGGRGDSAEVGRVAIAEDSNA